MYAKIQKATELEYYEDPNLVYEVHDFLKKHGIVKHILVWLKKEQKRIFKEIKKVELGFVEGNGGIVNPVVKEGFDLWKQSFVVMTHNKFIKQLEIDYEIV